MHAWSKLLALCAAVGVVGCGTMHPPASLSLGPPKQFHTVAIETGNHVLDGDGLATPGAGQMQFDAEALGVFMAEILSAKRAGAMRDGGAKHRIEYGYAIAPEYERRAREVVAGRRKSMDLRGTCVIVPGILGRDSASHIVDPLAEAGWAVVVVWPPLVDRANESMRASRGRSPRERGAALGSVVQTAIQDSASVAQFQLVALQMRFRELRGKPVLLIGESMGAIAGVGVAATGAVPYDAALFIAGGGGFLEVAEATSLRGLLFGGVPLEDDEFAHAFREACALDPLRAAEELRGGPVVVVTAANDGIVPTVTQEALWNALGCPPRFVWDGGHLDLFGVGRSSLVEVARQVSEMVGERSRAAEVLFRMEVGSGGGDSQSSQSETE